MGRSSFILLPEEAFAVRAFIPVRMMIFAVESVCVFIVMMGPRSSRVIKIPC